jgi:hypothetical protein
MNNAAIVAVVALLVAMIAFAHSRRMARRLAVLEEQYWQLKFEHGELKAKVDPPAPAAPEPKATFVPLIRLRPETKPVPGFGETGSPPQK